MPAYGQSGVRNLCLFKGRSRVFDTAPLVETACQVVRYIQPVIRIEACGYGWMADGPDIPAGKDIFGAGAAQTVDGAAAKVCHSG